jgi:predicted ATPase
VGDPPELFPALYGLWLMDIVRGEWRKGYGLAEELLRRAQGTNDPTLLLYARYALGDTSYFMGKFPPARDHFEMAIAIYDPERHRPLAFLYGGFDAGVLSLSYSALILWQLGYPDQALKRSNEALALAQTLPLPFTQVHAEVWVVYLRQYRREAGATQEKSENVIALCAEQGFTEWLAWATSLRGWAIAEQGRHEEGIAQIREGSAASCAIGAQSFRPYSLYLLAEACRRAVSTTG